MSQIKLCKDCQHSKRIGFGTFCMMKPDLNLVDGKPSYQLCSTRRKFFCAEDAYYFISRKTFWQKLKGWFR